EGSQGRRDWSYRGRDLRDRSQFGSRPSDTGDFCAGGPGSLAMEDPRAPSCGRVGHCRTVDLRIVILEVNPGFVRAKIPCWAYAFSKWRALVCFATFAQGMQNSAVTKGSCAGCDWRNSRILSSPISVFPRRTEACPA